MVQVGVESENGWRPPKVGPEACEWVRVPGAAHVSLQIQKGWPSTILRAWAADWHAYIEPLRDADSASWTPTNAVNTSNHLNATAIDLNWNSHPFRRRGSLNAAQMRTMSEMEDFYEGTVFWAGRWNEPVDEMHSQMGYGSWNNPHTGDFIRRKIRPDGFSTFRRGTAPLVVTVPLTDLGNGKWTSPSPAWAHLIKRESGGNPTIIQQIIDVNSGGNEAEGLFQITPRTWRAHNGQEFAPSARLATPQQQAIIAARIFTRNPSGSDWGAGLPGRENAAELAAGLITPTQQGDDMAAVPQDEWILVRDKLFQVWGAMFNKLPSKSRYADPNDLWATKDFVQNDDGFLFDIITEHDATLGDPKALARIQRAANEGDLIAQNFLEKLSAAPQPNPDVAVDVEAPPNNLECWQCRKNYPDVLPNCPFCNAPQTRPEQQPQPYEPQQSPQPQQSYEPQQGGSITLPGIDDNIVEQFLLLQRFSQQLPPDVTEAINKIIPVIQGLVGK